MIKTLQLLDEPGLSYYSFAEQDLFQLIEAVRSGIKYSSFQQFFNDCPFSMIEWSRFLNLSERTMQRYKKDKGIFDISSSEKILEVVLLYRYGVQVFGALEKFDLWLYSRNLALGGIKPKDLLDNSFGINLLKDELYRIEQGVLS